MEKKIKEYEKMFGEFPSWQLCLGRTENEVIEIIDKCLKYEKDAYELGIISLDDDIMY